MLELGFPVSHSGSFNMIGSWSLSIGQMTWWSSKDRRPVLAVACLVVVRGQDVDQWLMRGILRDCFADLRDRGAGRFIDDRLRGRAGENREEEKKAGAFHRARV
jgi:hypothetical protein